MTGIDITGYVPEHRTLIADFQRLLWAGGTAGNIAYLDWKYAESPYLDHRYITMAFEGDELVGMLGVFGSRWVTRDGEHVMLPCLADTVVVPEHRGGPLFLQMIDAVVERLRGDRVPWALDFGDQPAGPAMLMHGWRAIGPWPIARVRRDGPLADGLLWQGSGDFVRTGTRSGAPIRTADESDHEQLAKFSEQLPMRADISHVRDAEYLAWRSRNPLARYFYLSAGNGDLEGYLIAHRSAVPDTDAPTPTTIVECEAATDDLWLDLVETATSTLPGETVLIWARDTTERRLSSLDSLGFEPDRPTGRFTRDWHLPNLLVRRTGAPITAPLLDRLDDPTAWDLRAVCGRSWR